MGNISSGGGSGRRRHGSRRNDHTPPENPPISQPPPGISANQYIFAAASPYPNPNPNPNPNDPQYYQYPAYYPPPPPPPVMPYGHHHHRPYHPWSGSAGRYPYGQMMPPPPPLPYVEHQKAVTIRNDINLKKETLRLEPDEENPNRLLVCFTFDATVPGRITVIFFAKEGEECSLTAAKEEIYPPVTIDFEQGLGQKFRQPSGTGIDLSTFEDSELLKTSETEIYHLAVKAEAIPGDEESDAAVSKNSQITQAMFEKDKGDYKVRVVKQILWVNGMRYELQEIYGIGNNVEDDVDAGESSDSGKECVICLSEPRDTTVLPCRHMCMCSGCAKVLRFQTNRCPICRQPVERLLEIKVNNNGETTGDETSVPTN